MTTPATQPEKKLTLDDPIDSETLGKLGQLQQARLQCADRLLDLEQERVRILRAAAQVDAERQKVFEGVLLSRGLPPNFPVTIDGATGKMTPIPGASPEIIANRQAADQAENGAAKH